MQDDAQQQILKSFLVVLKPIARILLRCGIGFREFAEIAKTAFVDVATSDFGLRGRPTNISRVAVMTGLTRKEVRRLRDKIEGGNQAVVLRTTPLAEIMHRWLSEDEFLDDNGQPAVLPFSGEEGSFTNLVKRFGGDIPPGAMRTELRRIGAVDVLDDGSLVLSDRRISPEGAGDKLSAALVHSVYPMLCSIAHNTNPDLAEDTWPQMTAFTKSVRKEDVARLRRISRDRLIDVAESFDDLFMAYETLHESESDNTDGRPVAVGVFYFEERDKGMNSSW